MGKIPVRPGHPERICWGCEQYCPADDMRCGNGTERAQHPLELWGEAWMSMSIGPDGNAAPALAGEPAPASDSKGDPVDGVPDKLRYFHR